MNFLDHHVAIQTPFGSIDVVVSAEALHVLWGRGVGPQDGLGLIEANRDMIEQIAMMKLEAGECLDAKTVAITELDIDG